MAYLILSGQVREAGLKLGRLYAVAAEQVVVAGRGECCTVAGGSELVGIVAEDGPLASQEIVARGVEGRLLDVGLGCTGENIVSIMLNLSNNTRQGAQNAPPESKSSSEGKRSAIFVLFGGCCGIGVVGIKDPVSMALREKCRRDAGSVVMVDRSAGRWQFVCLVCRAVNCRFQGQQEVQRSVLHSSANIR